MSESPTNVVPVQTRALWTWTTGSGIQPSVTGFPQAAGTAASGLTKSGLTAIDLRAFVQVPLQQYGNPPQPIADAVINQWIRWAEDDIETETNIRLCQTWIAAPPAAASIEAQPLDFITRYGNYQQLGSDFDVQEPGYDFLFSRWQDEGWGVQRLRWRPVKSVSLGDPAGIVSSNFTGVKNIAFIYPLLNEYFRVPLTWMVEDQNRGLIRVVPATNVQMLPLFAMQLAFMGFAESVPSGLWFQYTAGLTAADWQSDWSFMKQLVLARAGATALGLIQTSINLGAIQTRMQADGLLWDTKYSEKGPFAGQVAMLTAMGDKLIRRAKSKGGGFHMGFL